MIHLTFAEYVEINSSMAYLFDPELRCEEKQYNTELAQKQMKFRKGCKIHTDKVVYSLYDLRYKTCPCTYYNRDTMILFELYKEYEKHGLTALRNIYNKGSYIPAKLYEAIKVIGAFMRMEEEKAQKIADLQRLAEQAKKTR